MSEILSHYDKVSPTTWVYLSSLLTIGLYFKFSRLWSVRNLDLIGLILFAPGLLMVDYGANKGLAHIEYAGYVWQFAVGGWFIIRLLMDPLMVRRPLLEPNLSVGGLTFIGLSLWVFLMANVITSKVQRVEPPTANLENQQTAAPVGKTGEEQENSDADVLAKHGPGLPAMFEFSSFWKQSFFSEKQPGEIAAAEGRSAVATDAIVRIATILSHLAIVLGMIVIGYRHFDSIRTGIAAATLYLLLPYTAQWTGRLDHVLPGALLVWAVVAYRRPLIAGILIALAIRAIFYPVFLLPLWIGFYWQRGLARFLTGLLVTVGVLLAFMAYYSTSFDDFLLACRQMFGWTFKSENFDGFWGLTFNNPVYRIPVLAAFVAACIGLAIWPAQKNLGTLLSCSAAVMLGTQFWHAYGGGPYMAWYLPLLLMTIFRPNLDDRVALTVLGEGWFAKRRPQIVQVDQAA